MRVIAGTTLISGAITGCLLTSSFDGIVGTKVTPLQDAASDLSVLPTDDASESGKPPPADTGGDTSPPATTFCGLLPLHTFCADFDQSSDPLTGWTALSTNGSVVLDTTNFVSAPAAALFTTPTTCSVLDKSFIGSTNVKILHYAADIQVIAPVNGATTLTSLTLGPTYTLYLLLAPDRSVFYNEDQIFADGGITFQSYGAGQLPAPGNWAHLKLDVVLGNPSVVTLLIGGNTILNKKNTGTLVSDGQLELQVGECIYQKNSGSILFDNVTVDLEY